MSYSIHPIDLQFKGYALDICSFLIKTNAGPIIVETGPHSCLDALTKGLAEHGYHKEDVKHVFLTHIHLDHAGGAWCFGDHGAKIYVHPLGFKHLHDPSKLLASAKMIYGNEMDRMWGTLQPIPADQFCVMADGEAQDVLGLTIVSHHTPGHAKHHTAWQLDRYLFTGDVAGIKHPEGAVIPPCPPPDINIDLWIASIDKVLAISEIDTYYVTHGAKVDDVAAHMTALKKALVSFSEFVKPYHERAIPATEILPEFAAFVRQFLTDQGLSIEATNTFVNGGAIMADLMGLMRYWKIKSENKMIESENK